MVISRGGTTSSSSARSRGSRRSRRGCTWEGAAGGGVVTVKQDSTFPSMMIRVQERENLFRARSRQSGSRLLIFDSVLHHQIDCPKKSVSFGDC